MIFPRNGYLTLFLFIIGPFALMSALTGLLNGGISIIANSYIEQNLQYVAVNTICNQVIHNLLFASLISLLMFAIAALVIGQKRIGFWVLPYVYIAQLGLIFSRVLYRGHWAVKMPALGLPLPGFLWQRYVVKWTVGILILIALILTIILLLIRKKPPQERQIGRYSRYCIRMIILAFLVGLLAKAVVLLVPAAEIAKPFNVVWITWDAVRADHLSCYGYSRLTSPNLDSFAQDAVRFNRVISQHNWTRPSYMSQFISLGMWEFSDESSKYNLSHLTLAEVLNNHGYRTIGYVQNPNLDAEFHMNQGFDSYFQLPESFSPLEMNYFVIKKLEKIAKSEKPFFLFVHIQEPHASYSLDNPFRKEFVKSSRTPLEIKKIYALMNNHGENWNPKAPNAQDDIGFLMDSYDSDIRYADEGFAQLLDTLKNLNLFENSLIIFNSDHGDEFGDRGAFGHAHKNLHPELTFVPLVIRFPNKLNILPKSIDIQVQSLDIFPTILSAIGIKPLEHISGISLLPLPESNDPERLALSKVRGLHVVRNDRYSLYVDLALGIDQTRFFDLDVDPEERKPIKKAEKISDFLEMKKFAYAWITEQINLIPLKKRKPRVSKDLLERLRSLGYLR